MMSAIKRMAQPAYLVPPRGRAFMEPAEFALWRDPYIHLLQECHIEHLSPSPFKSVNRLLDSTADTSNIHSFRGHAYFESQVKRRAKLVTIRIMFAYRGSKLSITAIEIYGQLDGNGPARSLVLLRSSINHARHSECSMGLKADLRNGTFVTCCSGLDAFISFEDPLSLYEEQLVKANWLQAIHARDRLEAVEMARDDEECDGLELDEGENVDPTSYAALLEKAQAQTDEIDRLKTELDKTREATNNAETTANVSLVSSKDQSTEIARLEMELRKARDIAYNTQHELQSQKEAMKQIEHERDELKIAASRFIKGNEKRQEDHRTAGQTETEESANAKIVALTASLRIMKAQVKSLDGATAMYERDIAKRIHVVECLSAENEQLRNEIAQVKGMTQDRFPRQHGEPQLTLVNVKGGSVSSVQNEIPLPRPNGATAKSQHTNGLTIPKKQGAVEGGRLMGDFAEADSEFLRPADKDNSEDQKSILVTRNEPKKTGHTVRAMESLQRPIANTSKEDGVKAQNRHGAATGNPGPTVSVENDLVNLKAEKTDGEENKERIKPSDDLVDLDVSIQNDVLNSHKEQQLSGVNAVEGNLWVHGSEGRHSRTISVASSNRVVITGCETDKEEWGGYWLSRGSSPSDPDYQIDELTKTLALLAE